MNDLIYWYNYIPVSQCCVEECHYLLILVVLYTEYTVGCVCLLYNGSVYLFDSANMIKLVIHTVPGSTSSQKCADLFAKILLDFGFFLSCVCMCSRVMWLVMLVYMWSKNWLFGVLLLENLLLMWSTARLLSLTTQKRVYYPRWFIQGKKLGCILLMVGWWFWKIVLWWLAHMHVILQCITVQSILYNTVQYSSTSAPSVHTGYVFCGTLVSWSVIK